MGFFSSIKKNLNHGGVKVSLDAPGSASTMDASLIASVTVTATDAVAVTKITVKLQAHYEQRGANNEVIPETRVISETQLNDGFQLAAGESKQFSVELPLNNGGGVGAALGVDGAAGKALNVASKLAGAFNSFGQNTTYTLNASADVPGIALDPSASRGISINQPGQFGSTINI